MQHFEASVGYKSAFPELLKFKTNNSFMNHNRSCQLSNLFWEFSFSFSIYPDKSNVDLPK